MTQSGTPIPMAESGNVRSASPAKRQELLEMAEVDTSVLYQTLSPSLDLGLPYIQAVVGADYHYWPQVPELLPRLFWG
jgi:hypothetical protein